MPIPPKTDHGFRNMSGHDHILPFVFGSMVMTGWGIFFDVEARANDEAPRDLQPLNSEPMNRSVFLDQAIQKASTARIVTREVLIPVSVPGLRKSVDSRRQSMPLPHAKSALTLNTIGSFPYVQARDRFRFMDGQRKLARTITSACRQS